MESGRPRRRGEDKLAGLCSDAPRSHDDCADEDRSHQAVVELGDDGVGGDGAKFQLEQRE